MRSLMLRRSSRIPSTSMSSSSTQIWGENINRRDSLGIEIGGEIRMTSAPGVYALRITIKDGKGLCSKRENLN